MASPSPESAPLLNERDTSTISDDYSQPTNARLASRSHRYVKTIRVSGLILSIPTVVLVIVNIILFNIAPFASNWWNYPDQLAIGWYIISAVTAIIILYAPVPALLSLVNDVMLLGGTFGCSVQWIRRMPLSICGGYYDWRTRKWIPPHPKCKDYQLPINIIMGFVAAFGILLVISYALLLLIRVYNVFKTKAWRKMLPGTGEITWIVSLNVLTDGQERTYGFSVGAKADLKPTQGPVHL